MTVLGRSPRVAVAVFPGTWSERDFAHVAEAVLGWEARLVWHTDDDLGRPDAVVLPGGFAHGDHLRTGAIARFSPIMRAVEAFAAAGGPVIGSCNGFQVLTEAGMLPGALLRNDHLEFRCDWQSLRVERPASAPAWLGRPGRRRRDQVADQPRRGAVRGRRGHPRCARARWARGPPLRGCRRTREHVRPTRTGRSAGSPASSTSAATCSA